MVLIYSVHGWTSVEIKRIQNKGPHQKHFLWCSGISGWCVTVVPSLSSLKAMLSIANECGKQFKVTFNALKTNY